jgi:RND family efflux transporter MFP subunit
MRYTFVVFFAASLSIGCNKADVKFKEVTRPIAWQAVSKSSFDQVRRLSGTVYPIESTDLSFEVSGKVDWVKVKLGDAVMRGTQLAQLDQRNFNLNMQSSLANLQQTQAALLEAENEYKRYEELLSQGLVSRSGYDNAKANNDSATSAVNIAKTQLDISQKNLDDTLLLAPYNGMITKRLVEPSMQVSSGQVIFEISGESGLEIQVMVPETLIKELSKEKDISIEFPAIVGIKTMGTITEIGSRAEAANAFPVTVVINSPVNGLRAGMTAELDFTFEGEGRSGYQGDIFKLPISALSAEKNQKSAVFIFNPESNTLEKRFVQTESIINNLVLISSGLKEGEIVAIAGVSFLRDGQNVSLLDNNIRRFN